MAIAQLIWRGKYGESRLAQGDAYAMAKKLENLRRPATLWLLDDNGKHIGEPIGGCEEANGLDDKRIKWTWWHDAEAVGVKEASDLATTQNAWESACEAYRESLAYARAALREAEEE